MRTDVAVSEVLAKCEALKRAGFWLPEPRMRPRAWIDNFEDVDQGIAALLLDRFTFYNSFLTDKLLIAAYESIGDGLPKGPQAPGRTTLLASLSRSVIAPVEGEDPNPTDSGNFLCRKMRQLLGLSERAIVTTEAALTHAQGGGTVVFVDDFIGSGDQFLKTWTRRIGPSSFEAVNQQSPFTCIYVALVATDIGIGNIHARARSVALCVTHVIAHESTVHDFQDPHAGHVDTFLRKYAPRLQPLDPYIAKNEEYRRLGYKKHGLFFAFEHSVPDSTLPLFWSQGQDPWSPLIERR